MKKHQIAAIIGTIILISFSLLPVILTIMVEGLIGLANPIVIKVFIYPIISIGISIAVITYALSKEDNLCISKMVNWRKGLFRLWIVISVFWIISVVVLNISEYNEASKKESRVKRIVSEINDPEKALKKIKEEFPELRQKLMIVYFASPARSKEELKKLSDEELVELLNEEYKIILSNLKMTCDYFEKNRKNTLYYIILLSIIPPILLMAIGSSIYWALRGFRI